ncbi:STAS/SEC14 domain-containing protein [Roseovarius nanhaiticus]|uniref:STAS/SEC14 domain-containing protein n=1 Tax=Roseovarius nanhaiticus TaxID=573024 RepID=UPI00249242E8|nr:STAS/SEC14 domain-containing protein [Roseovarius nanhaiticus]
MLNDIKIDTAHANDFARVAVAGESRWVEWGAKFFNSLTRSKMRWFDAGEIEGAVVWARYL